jgi:hypothetical protein
VAFSNYERFK